MKPAAASETAERVALTRAIESLRPPGRRWIHDPYVHRFLTGRMRRIYRFAPYRWLFRTLSERAFPGVPGAVMVRTRCMDDFLEEQLERGVRQVVNLGAGYDTRSLRFADRLGQATVYEVDHPATQKKKRDALRSVVRTPPANLVFVPLRFNRQNLVEGLSAAGCRPDLRTACIWEGVTYYLSPEAVAATLRAVAAFSAPGSSIAFDFFPPSVAAGTHGSREARNMRARFAKMGEPLTFGIDPVRVPAVLEEMGFDGVRVDSLRSLCETGGALGGRQRRVSGLFFMARARVSEGG